MQGRVPRHLILGHAVKYSVQKQINMHVIGKENISIAQQHSDGKLETNYFYVEASFTNLR